MPINPLRIWTAFAAAALAGSTLSAALPTQEDPRLEPVYSARRVWNGVATSPDGRAFVSYPDADGPGVKCEELFAGGGHQPYPNAEWNNWAPSRKPLHAFVHVNALRIGPDHQLWIVDAGAPGIGEASVKGGARLIQVMLDTNQVGRVFDLRAAVHHKTYVDDVRFNGDHAYLTDAGDPGLLVLDLKSGAVRRVLQGDASVTDTRPMYADEKLLLDRKGKELRAHADQLEVSPDGQYFYYQPASGPMSRIATRYLDDAAMSDTERAQHVEPWFDTPTSGGTAIDADGNLYLSDPKERRILKLTPQKALSVLIADPRLIWSDAMWIDSAGFLWIPATQQNLTPGFNNGKQEVKYPVWIYKLQIHARPPANDHS